MLIKIANALKLRKSFFKSENRGVAAIEFALIAPILIVLLFAAYDAIFALSAKRKTTITANAISDITSRLPTGTSRSEVRALLDLGRVMVVPFDSDATRISISQLLVQRGGDTAIVNWTEELNGSSGLRANQVIRLPSPLNVGEYVILSRVEVGYQTKFGIFDFAVGGEGTTGVLTLQEQAFFRTRTGGPVS